MLIIPDVLKSWGKAEKTRGEASLNLLKVCHRDVRNIGFPSYCPPSLRGRHDLEKRRGIESKTDIHNLI